MLFVYSIISFLIFFLIPDIAYAWGPGMHVEIALSVLARSSLVLPVVRKLIKKYPDAFIYGTTSPDIVVGKKYAGYFHHCHNWRIGQLILSEAKTERECAAAYGYLAHLAADIIAHNYYIPVKIIRSYGARVLTHTYWEMRFDLEVGDDVWKRIKTIRKLDIEEFDNLLDRALRKTLFSFSTNKRIFNTILILQKMRGLRSSLKVYASYSRFDIGEENRRHYVDLTMESVTGFLADPIGAPCFGVDPAGLARIAYAKNLRKNIRSALDRGLVGEKKAQEFVEFTKERLAMGVWRPDMPLPDVIDIL